MTYHYSVLILLGIYLCFTYFMTLFYFQGKGLLQTFWLIEEKRIEIIEPTQKLNPGSQMKSKAKRDKENE